MDKVTFSISSTRIQTKFYFVYSIYFAYSTATAIKKYEWEEGKNDVVAAMTNFSQSVKGPLWRTNGIFKESISLVGRGYANGN